MKIFRSLFLVSLFFISTSCGEKSAEDAEVFDRTAFLENVLEEFILADFQNLNTAVANLDNAVKVLVTSPSIDQLNTTRELFRLSILEWQKTNAYNFGPAGEQGLSRSLNEEIATFPISVEKVESRIGSGSFSFTDFDRDARGFFTLEYLLFGDELFNNQIIEKLADANYRSYLAGVSANIATRVSAVLNGWNSDVQTSFVTNNGTDAGSSISSYYNEYVKSFEALKNFKLGLPLGLRAGQTNSEPDRIEARFSGLSKQTLEADFQSVRRSWEGTTPENGFQFYLQSVTGGEELITSTVAQFDAIESAFATIEDEADFRGLIINEDGRLISLHTELQKLTRFLKSDMSSLLGIAITFASGDGD